MHEESEHQNIMFILVEKFNFAIFLNDGLPMANINKDIFVVIICMIIYAVCDSTAGLIHRLIHFTLVFGSTDILSILKLLQFSVQNPI